MSSCDSVTCHRWKLGWDRTEEAMGEQQGEREAKGRRKALRAGAGPSHGARGALGWGASCYLRGDSQPQGQHGGGRASHDMSCGWLEGLGLVLRAEGRPTGFQAADGSSRSEE